MARTHVSLRLGDGPLGRVTDLKDEFSVDRTLVLRAVLAVGLRHLPEVKKTIAELKEADA